jgi:hypothetical protein
MLKNYADTTSPQYNGVRLNSAMGHLPTFPSVSYQEFEISLIAMPSSRQSPSAGPCPERLVVPVLEVHRPEIVIKPLDNSHRRIMVMRFGLKQRPDPLHGLGLHLEHG